ncbi:hypothetical protein ACH49_08380 [Streptomyces leeuwenhoekii]|uniref:RNA polymerase sigma factor 70 region 4 type 2 domain-containing protein n=1 Tax=Streptomyces leeuwenhoekii TaxID=1437453 RepID=A0ABR5I1Y5_STRLW|nr:hypothetical protein ACH49_08380 [Streptomyces leeuwenhoekii]
MPDPGQEHRKAVREAESAILDILARDEFQGPRWERTTSSLAEYGWLTLVKWLGTGQIFDRCLAIGRRLPHNEAARIVLLHDWDTRFELASDTVLAALPKFRERLASGQWDPEQASLTTYFVGALILEFPNIYRRWERGRVLAEKEAPLDVMFDAPSAERGPAAHAAAHDEIQRILWTMPPDIRKIVQLRADGYTLAEAAKILGTTTKAIEHRMARWRTRYTKRRTAEQSPQADRS